MAFSERVLWPILKTLGWSTNPQKDFNMTPLSSLATEKVKFKRVKYASLKTLCILLYILITYALTPYLCDNKSP